jgi:hypothetical protein
MECICDAFLKQFRFRNAKYNYAVVYVTFDLTKLSEDGPITIDDLLNAIVYVGSCGEFIGRVQSTNGRVNESAKGKVICLFCLLDISMCFCRRCRAAKAPNRSTQFTIATWPRCAIAMYPARK